MTDGAEPRPDPRHGPSSGAGRGPRPGPQPAHDPAPPERPLRVLSRPWFWLLLVAVGFALPLLKSVGRPFPPRLPGADRAPLVLSLEDDTGTLRQLDELRGRLVVLTSLSLANVPEREATFAALRVLQKHLRGLSAVLGWAVLCPGGDGAELAALLDAKTARRPHQLWLLDPGGAQMDRLAAEAGSPSARFLLVDRHGRPRGAYGADDAELERLITEAGQLANWAAQDP